MDEANRKRLLASELTDDTDRATALAALAHEVGEPTDQADPETLVGVDG